MTWQSRTSYKWYVRRNESTIISENDYVYHNIHIVFACMPSYCFNHVTRKIYSFSPAFCELIVRVCSCNSQFLAGSQYNECCMYSIKLSCTHAHADSGSPVCLEDTIQAGSKARPHTHEAKPLTHSSSPTSGRHKT